MFSTSLKVAIAILCVLCATPVTRGEEPTTNNKTQAPLLAEPDCKKLSESAHNGKQLTDDERAFYLQCILSKAPPKFNPAGPGEELATTPPTTYLDSNGCLRDKTTDFIIQCYM
jgi:hypothetical protein